MTGVVSKALVYPWTLIAPPGMSLVAAAFTIDGDARSWVSASTGEPVQPLHLKIILDARPQPRRVCFGFGFWYGSWIGSAFTIDEDARSWVSASNGEPV